MDMSMPCAIRMADSSSTDAASSAAGESPQPAGIRRSCLCQLVGRGCRDRLHILRTEAQQRGNIAHLVEFRIALHVEGFNVAPNHPRQNSFADIDDFLRRLTIRGTGTDQVR